MRLLAGLSQRKRDSKITSECRDWLKSARNMQLQLGAVEITYTDEKKSMSEESKNATFYQKHGFSVMEDGVAMQICNPGERR